MIFTEYIKQAFDAISPDSLTPIRTEAMKAFEKLGVPSNRHEEWKYTPIKTKLPGSLRLSEDHSSLVKEDAVLPPILFSDGPEQRLVFINGFFSAEHSNITKQSGLIIGSFKDNLSEHRDIVLKYYNQATDTIKENFAALNTAFAQDGAFIYVYKNTQITSPVYIHHIFTSDSADVFTQSRNLIVAEQGSNVSIVEDFKNLTGEKFYNHVSEVFIGQNAEVNYVTLQIETKNSTSVNYVEARLEKDARYHITTVTFDGKMVRNNVNAYMDGENALATLNGLFLCDGDMHVDNHILVDHRVPNCNSNQVYKGVLNGESTGVFNGKIFVQKDAQKTNAYQSSKAILLSDEASMNSKPQLEIFADDVKCSHGAAIGQVSKNELFYLKARGIDEVSAKGILTYAFANWVINEIAIPEIRESLDGKLKEKLRIEF
jgi:Fe-S cluster assembly protein SufD